MGFLTGATGLWAAAILPSALGVSAQGLAVPGAEAQHEAPSVPLPFSSLTETTSDGRGRAGVVVLSDGSHLGMTLWLPEGAPRGVILALHGINDYGTNSYQYLGPDMAARGYAVYALDQRGHGRSSDRGDWPRPEQSLSDLTAILNMIAEVHGKDQGVILVGESMGGAHAVVAAARPDIEKRLSHVVLLAPALQGWDEQPWHRKLAAKTVGVALADIAIPVPEFLARLYSPTNNEVAFQQMLKDPLLINARKLKTVEGLLTLSSEARSKIGQIKAPVFLLYGGKDRLVPPDAIFSAVHDLKPTDQTAYYPEAWHVLNRDLHRADIFADIAKFLESPGASLPSGAVSVREGLGAGKYAASQRRSAAQ